MIYHDLIELLVFLKRMVSGIWGISSESIICKSATTSNHYLPPLVQTQPFQVFLFCFVLFILFLFLFFFPFFIYLLFLVTS